MHTTEKHAPSCLSFHFLESQIEKLKSANEQLQLDDISKKFIWRVTHNYLKIRALLKQKTDIRRGRSISGI